MRLFISNRGFFSHVFSHVLVGSVFWRVSLPIFLPLDLFVIFSTMSGSAKLKRQTMLGSLSLSHRLFTTKLTSPRTVVVFIHSFHFILFSVAAKFFSLRYTLSGKVGTSLHYYVRWCLKMTVSVELSHTHTLALSTLTWLSHTHMDTEWHCLLHLFVSVAVVILSLARREHLASAGTCLTFIFHSFFKLPLDSHFLSPDEAYRV